MDNLVTWLRAALDDDERVVRQVLAEPGGFYLEAETDDTNIMTIGAYVHRWNPARVLATIDATRQVLELHGQCCNDAWCSNKGCATCDAYNTGFKAYPCKTLRLLAQPYAGRDGFPEEWRAGPGA